MSLKIREWKYEYLTASYLLLQNRKASGRSIRLAASHAPRAPLGEMKPRCILGENTSAIHNNNRTRNGSTNNDLNHKTPVLPEKQQPRIMTPSATASPRAIARNQVQRHSARPTFTPPKIPPKSTANTTTPVSQPKPLATVSQQQPQPPVAQSHQPPAPGSQQQQAPPLPLAPFSNANQFAPGAPKLPPKNVARPPPPSSSEENDTTKSANEDKENFAVPRGRASRASKTPQTNRLKRERRIYSEAFVSFKLSL